MLVLEKENPNLKEKNLLEKLSQVNLADFSWSDAAREAWKIPDDLTVSEWADKHRMLDHNSAEPGRYRTSRVPYAKEIMNAFSDPEVEEITIMASTQTSKTTILENMVGYAIAQDPGPGLFVMPTKPNASDLCTDRLQVMLKASPDLRRFLTRNSDDLSQFKIKTRQMNLYFGWAGSPASLASKAIRYLFLDETDKYPPFSGKEADPVKLATERTRTFTMNRKIVKGSTPTTRDGYIYREYEKTDQRKYYVPCPHCGEYQLLLKDQIKVPKDERDTEKIKACNLAWYECKFCSGIINDVDKIEMLERGVWVPAGCDINKKGEILGEIPQTSKRGYWLNALYSPWLTFSEIIAEWFSCMHDPAELMNFVNSWLAEIWEDKVEETKATQLKKLCLPYEAGTVPEGCLMLTAGVDVQKEHFYYVIRGWGYEEESWLISARRVELWEDVITYLFKTQYPVVNSDRTLSVAMACIDSGFATDEVYRVVKKWSDVAKATKGKEDIPGQYFKTSTIEKFPKSGKAIPGGLKLWTINTAMFKDKIHRHAHSEPGDYGQWHLYQDVSDAYCDQICAEHKIKLIDRTKKNAPSKEVWVQIGSRPNHYLDCEVGATAAAQIAGVQRLRREKESTKKKREEPDDDFIGNVVTNDSGEGWI